MTEINSLEELGGAMDGAGVEAGAVANNEAAPVYVQKLDAQGRAYATGKRKDAVSGST